jgi:hypothetical protein
LVAGIFFFGINPKPVLAALQQTAIPSADAPSR